LTPHRDEPSNGGVDSP